MLRAHVEVGNAPKKPVGFESNALSSSKKRETARSNRIFDFAAVWPFTQ
jgi:hypothetical protein